MTLAERIRNQPKRATVVTKKKYNFDDSNEEEEDDEPEVFKPIDHGQGDKDLAPPPANKPSQLPQFDHHSSNDGADDDPKSNGSAIASV